MAPAPAAAQLAAAARSIRRPARARQECPDFGDMAVTAAWPLPDPAKFTGSPVERAALRNELYASLGVGRLGAGVQCRWWTACPPRVLVVPRSERPGGCLVQALRDWLQASATPFGPVFPRPSNQSPAGP